MNMFQIHTAEGSALNMGFLDQMAAGLWGKEVHPEDYAYPKHMPEKFESSAEEMEFFAYNENWYDKIGYRISQGNTTWAGLKEEILKPFRDNDISDEELEAYPGIWGFVKLIDLWESKGYIPASLAGDYTLLSKGGKTAQQIDDEIDFGAATAEQQRWEDALTDGGIVHDQQKELDMLSAANEVDVKSMREEEENDRREEYLSATYDLNGNAR